ncbi:MAG TPA: penicillin-binding protein activator LpoB [Phycisphaerales bacterium]|nr:penicillin-binding protein activator LpoB [Phycisphaerales bacterium]
MHTTRHSIPAAALAAAALALTGCAPDRQITRLPPEQVIDLDYRFDDDDARQVAQAMVTDALYRAWVQNFVNQNGRPPVVTVGPIKNDTQDYIDPHLFSSQFERELINSGRVRFVAMRDQRGDIRMEREQGQEWSRPETRKQMKYELGADYILLGNVADNKERSLDGKRVVSFYQVNLEMIDLESNEKVWYGTHEIKKLSRDR